MIRWWVYPKNSRIMYHYNPATNEYTIYWRQNYIYWNRDPKKRIKWKKSDPVFRCDVYKNEGCAHVDGYLCDFPNCSMYKDYIGGRSLAD